MDRLLARLTACLLLVLAPERAEAQDSLTSHADLRAPHGMWQTVGGGSDRSRATRTRVAREAPSERAYEVVPDGKLVGEPLFNDSVLVLETRVSRDEHRITVYELKTGETIADRDFEVVEGCHPFLVDDLLVLRTRSDQLTSFRLTGNGMRRVAAFTVDGFVGAPFAIGEHLFVAHENRVHRLHPRSMRSVESTAMPNTLEGPVVSPLYVDRSQDPDGGWMSVGFLTRSSLAPQAHAVVAHFDPARDREPTCEWRIGLDLPYRFGNPLPRIQPFTIAPYFDGLIVHHPLGLFEIEGLEIVSMGFGAKGEPIDGVLTTTFPIAAHGHSVIAHFDAGKEGEHVLLLEHEGERRAGPAAAMIGIAGEGLHEELLPQFAGATWAHDVALFAGRAWHSESGRVLWHVPGLENAALYPTAHGVLAVRRGSGVEHWERPFQGTLDGSLDLGAERVEPFRGVLITGDGETRTGTFALRDGEPMEVRSTGERRFDDDVWFLGAEDGTVHVVGSPEAIGPGVDAIVRRLDGEDFSRYSNAAERSRDPKRIRRAIERGTDLAEDLEDLLEALADVEDGEASISSKQADRFDEYETLFATRRARVFTRALESVRPDEAALDPIHVAALRALLERRLALEAVRADVVALLPEGLSLPRHADLGDWIDFIRSTNAYSIRIVEPPPENQTTMTWEERRLGAATRWSEDVVGFESENLFVISSVDQPGAIASSLAQGEHLCRYMEAMFEGGEHQRAASHRTVVYLFDSQEQYLEESSKGDQAVATGLAWTAGHYHLRDGVSRFFLPDTATEFDWENAQETFRHELAHQWMAERCPSISDEDGSAIRPAQRGFWIVEGFACLMQDFEVDELRGITGPINRHSPLLDTVANAKGSNLIEWSFLAALKQVRLSDVAKMEPRVVPFTWRLGRVRPVDGIGLFYAQSNALASYLFHGAEGRHRQAFLDYLVAYYTGSADLDFESRFGLTPQEAGRLAVEHARSVVGASGSESR